MHDYIDKSMKNVEKNINDMKKRVQDKEVESLEFNAKSFEQRVVTTLIVAGIMFFINMIIAPILTVVGLYQVELVRYLCLLATLVGTSVYSVRNIVKFDDRETFKDYLNTNKRRDRLIEEFNKTIKVAQLNTNLTINQMTYNNLLAEKVILSSLNDRYKIDDKNISCDELNNGLKLLDVQKGLLSEKIDVDIKKCVMLGRFEKIILGSKMKNLAIKYGVRSLVVGLVLWNLPQIVTNILVGFPSVSLTSLVLTSVMPPAIASILFALWGEKRELDENNAFNTLNQELGSDSFDNDFTEDQKNTFMEEFDKTINEYAGVNTKCELLKTQIEQLTPTSEKDKRMLEEKQMLVDQVLGFSYEYDKNHVLSLKKRDKRK